MKKLKKTKRFISYQQMIDRYMKTKEYKLKKLKTFNI